MSRVGAYLVWQTQRKKQHGKEENKKNIALLFFEDEARKWIYFNFVIVFLLRTNCRANNYGTRLDYIFVSAKDANDILTDCDIYPGIQGSDHCPGSNVINTRTCLCDKAKKWQYS